MTATETAPKALTIGGSRAAAVLGQVPEQWTPGSPLEAYLELIGELPEKPDNEAMRWGRILEEPVADRYAEVTGRKVRRETNELAHKDYPFLTAHLDRKVLNCDPPRILEVKTGSVYAKDGWGEPGTDMVPIPYFIQGVHYLALTRAQFCDFAVLLGGQDFRIYTIERDPELIDLHVGRLVKFWRDHVVPRIPPPPMVDTDWSYVRSKGTALRATAEDVAMVRAYDAAAKVATAAEGAKKAARMALVKRLGENERLELEGRLKPICKLSPVREVDIDRLRAEHPEVYTAGLDFGVGRAEAAGFKAVLDHYRQPSNTRRIYTDLENVT